MTLIADRYFQIGEGFVRELEFSRLTFKLNGAMDGEKEEIFAQSTQVTKDFLELALVSSNQIQY
jgi:hypothetical protein